MELMREIRKRVSSLKTRKRMKKWGKCLRRRERMGGARDFALICGLLWRREEL